MSCFNEMVKKLSNSVFSPYCFIISLEDQQGQVNLFEKHGVYLNFHIQNACAYGTLAVIYITHLCYFVVQKVQWH